RHDLVLRLTGKVEPRAIVHLAKLLVHGAAGTDMPVTEPTKIKRHVPTPAPRVSLIIPTRDNADVLEICVRSIRSRTHYENYEILIIDNGSVVEEKELGFG